MTFKRPFSEFLKSMSIALVMAFFAYCIGLRLALPLLGRSIVTLLIFLCFCYYAFYSESIAFRVTYSGELRYYRRGRLIRAFTLSQCQVAYSKKNRVLGHEITLSISEKGKDEKAYLIDCSPIGGENFNQMYKMILESATVEPEVLSA